MKKILIGGFVLCLTACTAQTVPQTQAGGYPPVPPPPAEIKPLPPVSSRPLIWQPGHYDWSQSAYVWVPGRYVDRTTAGNGMWQPGYWTNASGGWTWLPGHWTM